MLFVTTSLTYVPYFQLIQVAWWLFSNIVASPAGEAAIQAWIAASQHTTSHQNKMLLTVKVKAKYCSLLSQ